MHVYDYNAILATATKNIIDKDMIRDFTSLTEDLKFFGINPGFHFIDNGASTTLNMAMTYVNIKYQLVPPINHRANNAERAIQKFKNHFILGLCSLDKKCHLQLWYIIL